MKFLTLLSIIPLVLGDDIIRPGSLYITPIGNQPQTEELSFKSRKLVAGEKTSTFTYAEAGFIKSSDTSTYLGVNEIGQLVQINSPHYGFSLRTEPNSGYKRHLAYQGDESFEICSDNSIAYKTKCEGARKIQITYQDLFHPR